MTVESLCRRRHPAEWSAPVPRTTPCSDCTVLLGALTEGSTMSEATAPVVCPEHRPVDQLRERLRSWGQDQQR